MRTKLSICIVEDDAEVRSSLESFLRSAGLQVCGYGAAEEFLADEERRQTGCLVTDLHMPGMDGLALQRELLRQNLGIPVIVMTAFPTDAARDTAAALGAAGFFAKPVDPEQLLERIETLLV